MKDVINKFGYTSILIIYEMFLLKKPKSERVTVLIKGVRIIDDLDAEYDKQVLGKNELKQVKKIWNKIPATFIDIDSWITSTNLKCWFCHLNYVTVPVPGPKRISPDGAVSVEGLFHSLNCAQGFIEKEFKNNDQVRTDRTSMLRIVANRMGMKKQVIVAADSPLGREDYGGDQTIDEYIQNTKNKNGQLIKSYRYAL
jgi:hypothetical protein